MPNVAYRHSPSFESDTKALATSSGRAERQQLRLPSRFMLLGSRIREGLTSNTAGVALALVEAFREDGLERCSMVAGRPPSSLSARHKSDDHLWFTRTCRKAWRGNGGRGQLSGLPLPPRTIRRRDLMLQRRTCPAIRLGAGNCGIVLGRLQHEGRIRRNRLNGHRRCAGVTATRAPAASEGTRRRRRWRRRAGRRGQLPPTMSR